MFDKIINKKGLMAIALWSLFAFLLASCGGGGESRSIGLGGIVMSPTTTLNISGEKNAGKSFVKQLGDSATADVVCHIYTFEGEDLGSGTTNTNGEFLINVLEAALKGVEDSGTEYSEDVILECSNGISLFANISVSNGTSTIDLGTANTETTMALNSLANGIEGFSGWGSSYKDKTASLDLSCIFDSTKSLWENSESSGAGLSDDNGILKDLISGFIAAGGSYVDLGFNTFEEMVLAVLNGTITGTQLQSIADTASAMLGVDSSEIVAAYNSSQEIFAAMNSIFLAQFRESGLGLADLISGDSVESVCSAIKSGLLDPNALVKPLLASEDLSSFSQTYGSDNGFKLHLGLLEECTSEENDLCSSLSEKPDAYFGFMNDFGGDYAALFDGASFNTIGLSGLLLAPRTCESSDPNYQRACAIAMRRLIYTGAGGNWNLLATDGVLDEQKLAYLGGFYTVRVEDESYDSSTEDFESSWQERFGELTDTTAVDAVEKCILAKKAAGSEDFSSCYTIDPTSQTKPSNSYDLAGIYDTSTVSIAGSCDFYPLSTINIRIFSDTSMSINDETFTISYNLETATGTASNQSSMINFGVIKTSAGRVIFFFTSGRIEDAQCSADAGRAPRTFVKRITEISPL